MAVDQELKAPSPSPLIAKQDTEKKKEETPSEPKKQRRKKVFINDDIFGSSKTLEDIPPEDGIAHLKIKAQEIGNIPGLIEHWKKEIENRTKAIQKLKKQSFFRKAHRVLKGNKIPSKICGEEIAKLHPTKAAMEKVKLLKRNPTDMDARLELVAIVAKSGRDFPIEIYREFLLEATVANSFGAWSNAGIQMVIWTQDMYFSKLYYKCKGEAMALEAKIKSEQGKENAFTRQSAQLRKHISDVTRNMEIIKNYQKQSKRAIKENKALHEMTLSLEEITGFLTNSENNRRDKASGLRDEKYLNILKRASEILLLLRVLPLLKPQADKLSGHLKKLDKNDPFVHFLEAKLGMSDLILKVGQYQGGQHTTTLRAEIQESFKKALNSYGLAVKKVGKFPKTRTEHAIFIEYANLIHYFYKISKTVLGLRLPKEWLQVVFTKAMRMLAMIEEPGVADDLIRDLERDMADENIAIDLQVA